jgi:hypothetical protein
MMGSRRRGWRRRVAPCGDRVVLLCVFSVELSFFFCHVACYVVFGLRGHIYTQDIRMTFSLLSLYPSKGAALPMGLIDTKDETLHRTTPRQV